MPKGSIPPHCREPRDGFGKPYASAVPEHARVSLPPVAICAALRAYWLGAADFFGKPRPTWPPAQSDEARRNAANIARLPGLVRPPLPLKTLRTWVRRKTTWARRSTKSEAISASRAAVPSRAPLEPPTTVAPCGRDPALVQARCNAPQ
jgi:hypothetical protein